MSAKADSSVTLGPPLCNAVSASTASAATTLTDSLPTTKPQRITPNPSIARPQITDHPIYIQVRALPNIDDDSAFRAAIVYLDLFESKW